MKGLELAEKYYEAYGRQMLEDQFADIKHKTAVGLVGYGSECLGFDDDISKDHDYGPSFCIWLPREVYKEYGARMQEAYDALPKEFMGFAGRMEEEQGKGRVGVLCLEDFYEEMIGRASVPQTEAEWLAIPEEMLATTVNGKVFEDHLRQFSSVREGLMQYYPHGVWIRKIADSMAKAAQAGQYNYARAMKRGERIAAEMALVEFVKESMHLVYLLNRTYAPFYKWMHRGLQSLATCSEIGDMLNLLYQIPDPASAWEGVSATDYVYNLNTNDGRVLIIEAVCNILVQELNEKGLSDLQDNFLQNHIGTVLGKL